MGAEKKRRKSLLWSHQEKSLEVNFRKATFLLLMIPPNLTRRRWESLHSELTFVIIFEAFYQAVHTKMGWC